MYGMNSLSGRPARLKIFITAVIVLLVAAALAVGYVLATKDKVSQKPQTDDAKATTARVIQKVGVLYELPSGEEPTVAAIQDRTKLDSQAFFKNARNGDYLLVYTKAQLALIYRESANKLVTVGPVNTQAANSADATQQQAANTPSGGTTPTKP
jgi:hypothetical protein